MSGGFAATLAPPYYAVIFTTKRTAGDQGYADMAQTMDKLASQQPGYLGIESAREAGGLGITVSYWRDEQSIAAWKTNLAHASAQHLGRDLWYEHYELRASRGPHRTLP